MYLKLLLSSMVLTIVFGVLTAALEDDYEDTVGWNILLILTFVFVLVAIVSIFGLIWE